MHPQADVDRLNWKRAEGWRELQSVEETVHLEEFSLGFYLKEKEEGLLKEVIKEGIIKVNEDPDKTREELTEERK